MNKVFSLLLAMFILFATVSTIAVAEDTFTPDNPPPATNEQMQGAPPEKPDGQPPEAPPDGMGGGLERPGEPPEKPDGQMPTPPDGMPGGKGGPGMQSAPETREAVYTYDGDTTISNLEAVSTSKDENAVLVNGGKVVADHASVIRQSEDSTGGDGASFYGVGAAMLVTDGELTVSDSIISTDAEGGAGVFAYGTGVAHVSNCTISTERGTSGGIHVAGGGTLYADQLTVTTNGGSAAAIRSDRGGGTMVVNGGSFTSNGSGSPAVYVTADITINQAELNATGSEALCLEGRNSIVLNDCVLEGNMPDQAQNDNTWNVILYQSMSGDAEIGKGTFTMDGGKLISHNGGIFYTTNTVSEFHLRNVEIIPGDDHEYLLRCTGNSNQRGWGRKGANGAECLFTCEEQLLNGSIIWDSISTLKIEMNHNSVFTGAVFNDESHAGNGGNGSCELTIYETSKWIITGDSELTALTCKGVIVDEDGRSVSIMNRDHQELVHGDSIYTITVGQYIE